MSEDRSRILLEAVPLEGLRRVIARRLTESLREMAQLTLHREAEASPLLKFRAAFDPEVRPSVNTIVLAAVARVLPQHPSLNATLEDETIYRWRQVDLGMAVAVEGGLVVPVIRNADELSVLALQEEAVRLSTLAREGTLTMAEIEDGTFTVSNLGGFGIDGFTPIVSPPQVAILGVGRLRKGTMTLSLTIDHRGLDGVPGAQFLEDVARVFSDPGKYF